MGGLCFVKLNTSSDLESLLAVANVPHNSIFQPKFKSTTSTDPMS